MRAQLDGVDPKLLKLRRIHDEDMPNKPAGAWGTKTVSVPSGFSSTMYPGSHSSGPGPGMPRNEEVPLLFRAYFFLVSYRSWRVARHHPTELFVHPLTQAFHE